MCTRAIYLEKGKLIHDGGVKEALSLYQDRLDLVAKSKKQATLNPELVEVEFLASKATLYLNDVVHYGDELALRIKLHITNEDLRVRVLLRDGSGTVIQDWSSARENINFLGSSGNVEVGLGPAELAPGTYSISIEITSKDGINHLCLSDHIVFRVIGEYYAPLSIQRRASWVFL